MARVKPDTAALVVSYCTVFVPDWMERMEAVLTMLPPPARCMAGMAALAQNA